MTSDNPQVDFERIRILFSGIMGMMVGIVILLLFIFIFIYAHFPSNLAWIWALATITSIVPRLLVVLRFKRGLATQKISPENILPWEGFWAYTSIPFMLAFASLLFLPFSNSEELLTVTLFLIVLSAASVLTSNTSLKTLLVSNTFIILPLIVRLFVEQQLIFTLLGSFCIIAIIVFRNYAIRVNRTLMENIQLKIDNENVSLTDPLTNLWNRRGLNFFIEKLIPRSQRSSEPFAVIMIDIDNFKKYNDEYGHNAGDVELARVATCIEQETRDGDLVVRYGGEEFLVVLPATSMEQTKEVAERIFRNIRSNAQVTISGGLATYSPKSDFRDLIQRADDALYAAKAAGRDRFITSAETV